MGLSEWKLKGVADLLICTMFNACGRDHCEKMEHTLGVVHRARNFLAYIGDISTDAAVTSSLSQVNGRGNW